MPKWICEKWERKIINIHPSLLPKYGGKGMYGVKVQEAILRNHEKYAGCTVHYVDSGNRHWRDNSSKKNTCDGE
ncbi:hypothetical protein NXW89_17290 [Bacteroides thetaiotaomicron]|nr:hypothetical protein [Bacteroides thetaiotaomicron]